MRENEMLSNTGAETLGVPDPGKWREIGEEFGVTEAPIGSHSFPT